MRRALFGLILILLCSCDDGQPSIDIDLPTNQASPYEDPIFISQGMVVFTFEEMLAAPSSMDDTNLIGAPIISFPTSGGFGPKLEEFDVTDAPLKDNTMYRVKMFGYTAQVVTGTPKYQGLADCPFNKAFGDRNNVHLCFGLNSTQFPPLCNDTLPFSACVLQ